MIGIRCQLSNDIQCVDHTLDQEVSEKHLMATGWQYLSVYKFESSVCNRE